MVLQSCNVEMQGIYRENQIVQGPERDTGTWALSSEQ